MTCLQLLSEFIAFKFPWWGVCHITFKHEIKTVYIYNENPNKRAIILRDAREIARLDIGVDQFVIVQPGYSEIMIPMIANKDFKN
ncbi:hypothetical protein [Calothrix sp. UHCC 0171]|uniref:hypothetical protein n=1 Tax=Calothrix sp. UHCC 0171 TaxID=3110245 RepID=UPI002B1F0620|nr:hypothetical protein [Calothrix sp. UHCC 0171]MEA5571719.1 hypothetical protein [Calothrix sp. UHCC 0171]